MKRYEGMLRPLTRPASYPARWAVVSCEGRTVPVKDRPRLRQTGLCYWHARILTMKGPACKATDETSGQEPSGLWRLLLDLAARPGSTWVISPRALWDWTLLGLWERLMLSQVGVASSRARVHASVKDRGLRREPGCLMVGDPPSAVVLEIGPERKRVTWVCAGNYGWKGLFSESSAAERTAALARAVCEASAALAEHALGGWSLTIGSMALRAWRANHLKECLYVDNDSDSRRLEEAATLGGRCQAFTVPGRTARGYFVDAVGLYNNLAASSHLPRGLRGVCLPGVPAVRTVQERPGAFLARVRIRSNRGRFPVRTDTGTDYPQGDCLAVLAGPELSEALNAGMVTDIMEAVEYEMSTPLAFFSKACWQMRRQAKEREQAHTAILAKALAVSVIGALAQRNQTWEECDPDYNDPICGHWQGPDGQGGQTTWRAVCGQVSRLKREGLAAHAIPAIPLWIWSMGRCWLWERLCVAGVGHVLYCDTDGFAVTERGYRNLCDRGYIMDRVWGQLRTVAGPVEIEVMGPKMLRVGDELHQAGAPKDQRGSTFAKGGFWFRRSFRGGNGAFQESIWEEEYRGSSD